MIQTASEATDRRGELRVERGELPAVSLLTGGDDPDYAIPLGAALADAGVPLDFIGSDQMQRTPALRQANLRYVNLRGDQGPASAAAKVGRILKYYARLLVYAVTAKARVFHILWENKFELFDRTLLLLIYKAFGKKLVLTAHNVNMRRRDGNDTLVNRLSLRIMYSLADHIFVHTTFARQELMADFAVPPQKISLIPFGMNTFVPESPLSRRDARAKLGIDEHAKMLLFFGQIAPYKGLDLLVDALRQLGAAGGRYDLVVAGRPKRGCEEYWRELKASILADPLLDHIVLKDVYIPEELMTTLFAAADALVLPYRWVYQSGPLFQAYRFGVPVIATDAGSFATDIEQGVTGFVCAPDAARLAAAIETFFSSDLYEDQRGTRERIKAFGLEHHSWPKICSRIIDVYCRLAGAVRSPGEMKEEEANVRDLRSV
jgi:D-inositol-3-phosphate glycosyltransferase